MGQIIDWLKLNIQIFLLCHIINLHNAKRKKRTHWHHIGLTLVSKGQKSSYLWYVPFRCHTNKWLSWIASKQRTAFQSSLLLAHSQSPALVHSCVRTLSLLLCVSLFQWLYTTQESFSVRQLFIHYIYYIFIYFDVWSNFFFCLFVLLSTGSCSQYIKADKSSMTRLGKTRIHPDDWFESRQTTYRQDRLDTNPRY